MTSKQFDKICEVFKGSQRDRALKIYSNQDIDPKERKLFWSNILVKNKVELRSALECEGMLCKKRHEFWKHAKTAEELRNLNLAADYYMKAAEIETMLEPIQESIRDMGYLLMEVVRGLKSTFNDKEIACILSAPIKHIEEIRKDYKESESGFFCYAAFVAGAEYQEDIKGRLEGIYDCPRHEMPFYWASSEAMLYEMEHNKELKKNTDKYMYEQFGLKKGCYISKQDPDGRVVSMEPVIKNMTVEELLKNYTGDIDNQFISNFKNSDEVVATHIMTYEVDYGSVTINGKQYEYIPGMRKVESVNGDFIGVVSRKEAGDTR